MGGEACKGGNTGQPLQIINHLNFNNIASLEE